MSEIDDIKAELSSLPRGTITHKTISGKTRTYLQWRENGKYKSLYLKDRGLDTSLLGVSIFFYKRKYEEV